MNAPDARTESTVKPSDFRQYKLPAPAYEDVATEYEQLTTQLEAATSGDEAVAVVVKWDALRRQLSTWNQLAADSFFAGHAQ